MKIDWEGQFGNDYTERNTPDVTSRYSDFLRILGYLRLHSIHEVGCNKGVNLFALRGLFPYATITGSEVNKKILAKRSVPFDVTPYMSEADLVFTCGVLIHIPPKELLETMSEIINKSNDYVLAIEYFASEETEIEYRGKNDMLWKRDYGKLYQDLGLTLIATGEVPEIDNSTYWLLEKSDVQPY